MLRVTCGRVAAASAARPTRVQDAHACPLPLLLLLPACSGRGRARGPAGGSAGWSGSAACAKIAATPRRPSKTTPRTGRSGARTRGREREHLRRTERGSSRGHEFFLAATATRLRGAFSEASKVRQPRPFLKKSANPTISPSHRRAPATGDVRKVVPQIFRAGGRIGDRATALARSPVRGAEGWPDGAPRAS